MASVGATAPRHRRVTAAQASRFVEPSIVLLAGCLRSLLTSTQLRDPESEAALAEVLAHFLPSAGTGGCLSQDPSQGGAPAPAGSLQEGCARAFDFFDALVG